MILALKLIKQKLISNLKDIRKVKTSLNNETLKWKYKDWIYVNE